MKTDYFPLPHHENSADQEKTKKYFAQFFLEINKDNKDNEICLMPGYNCPYCECVFGRCIVDIKGLEKSKKIMKSLWHIETILKELLGEDYD